VFWYDGIAYAAMLGLKVDCGWFAEFVLASDCLGSIARMEVEVVSHAQATHWAFQRLYLRIVVRDSTGRWETVVRAVLLSGSMIATRLGSTSAARANTGQQWARTSWQRDGHAKRIIARFEGRIDRVGMVDGV